MAFRFEFTPKARAQARAAHAWIAVSSQQRASRWTRGLITKIRALETFPRRFPVSSDSKAFGEEVREFLHGRKPFIYRVLYAIRGDLIVVVSIWHTSRGHFEP